MYSTLENAKITPSYWIHYFFRLRLKSPRTGYGRNCVFLYGKRQKQGNLMYLLTNTRFLLVLMSSIWQAMCFPQWITRYLRHTTVIALFFTHFTYFHWLYTDGIVYSVLEHPKKLVKCWLYFQLRGFEFFPWQVYGKQTRRILNLKKSGHFIFSSLPLTEIMS